MIQVKEIAFAYNKARGNILQDVSFDVEKSHCIAILGNNGAGKSTLIKCIDRIHPVDEGVVYVDDKNVFEMSSNEVAKNIAFVAQHVELSHTTVFDTVLLGRKPYMKWDCSAEDRQIVCDILKKMEMENYQLRYINELSSGELQKVMLARALAQQPKFLLLDEPTSNLDPRNQHEMLKIVLKIAQESNISVAIIIHDLNLAIRYCDRFLFLKDAQVYSYGGVETVTPQALEDVYNIHAHIIDHYGIPIIVPFPDLKK